MTVDELGGSLQKLLSTLKKNREQVGVAVLKTQYKHPYEALLNQINQAAAEFVKMVTLRGLIINPNVNLDEQIDVINGVITDSGLLCVMGRSISRHYNVAELHSLSLELRSMIEMALQPFISLEDCLVADLFDLEKEPVIYNTLTKKVYENNAWINQELCLQGKLLVYLKQEKKLEPQIRQLPEGGYQNVIRESRGSYEPVI